MTAEPEHFCPRCHCRPQIGTCAECERTRTRLILPPRADEEVA